VKAVEEELEASSRSPVTVTSSPACPSQLLSGAISAAQRLKSLELELLKIPDR
jgi:hypothetical protein